MLFPLILIHYKEKSRKFFIIILVYVPGLYIFALWLLILLITTKDIYSDIDKNV